MNNIKIINFLPGIPDGPGGPGGPGGPVKVEIKPSCKHGDNRFWR